jgi:hypothetical protein
MPIPTAHVTPDIAALQAAAEAFMKGGFKGGPPEKDDLVVVGAFVTTFNFIEFNLRRAIRLFKEKGALTEAETKKAPVGELPNLVKKGLHCIGLTQAETARIHAALDEIALRQPFRNLLAHWALRHLPDTDAVVLVTMDEKDAKQIGQTVSHYQHLSYCVMQMADLRGLAEHVIKIEQRLARDVVSWQSALGLDIP